MNISSFSRQVFLVVGMFLLSTFIYSVPVGASDTYCGTLTACCKDAKLCPDGTVLGRQLPLCDFPDCPTTDSGTIAGCGSAANKTYPYGSTAYSGSLCVSGSSPTVGNNNVPFPAPGKTVTWTCFNRSSPSVDCWASQNPAPITCGPADKQNYSSPTPPSNLLCSDGSVPTVSYRLSGGYKIGWSWTCGSNSCSANISPGSCGSADGTIRATAPSTVAELCSAGLASSVSGSGPWTWSCTGKSCSANKTVSSCTPSCPNPSSYCTTTPIYDTNCTTYCGNGTANCPEIKVCPASITINSLETTNLTAEYWSTWSGTSLPTCSSGGSIDKTSSATWSRSLGLATTAVVGNGDADGAKGLVTAGSPPVNSSITVKAVYNSSLSSTSTVRVNAAVSPIVNVIVQAIPASGSAPLVSTIRATVSGTATGSINYVFDCDNGTTQSFPGESVTTKDYDCTYSTAGSYTPTVSVVQQGVPANGNASVTVSAPSGQLLTVSKSGTGTGTITSVPAGISYPGDSSESYATGTAVVLTASPTAGSTFVGWGGDCSGSGTCSVSMTSPKNVTATFDPPTTCDCNDPNVCIGSSYTGTGAGCAPNGCSGIKTCSQHWKEVAP